METPLSASLGGHEKPALELSHFERRVVGCCHHALALTPRFGHDQSRALSLQRLSPPSSLLWAPRTPSRHGGISPSAYTHRLCPTWAVEEGLPSSASGYPCVPSSLPRKRPAPLSVAVCCLRRDVTGSAAPPFGFLSHGAAKFTLPHSARSFASLARDPTVPAGLSTLRSGMGISPQYPEPATRRSGAFRDGTLTRWPETASSPPTALAVRSGRDTGEF